VTGAVTTRCPHCWQVSDCHYPTNDDGGEAVPAAGDLLICWHCCGLAYYASPVARAPTAAELAEVAANPDVRRALAAIAECFTPEQAVALIRGPSTTKGENER
jgi:hypothetical protein